MPKFHLSNVTVRTYYIWTCPKCGHREKGLITSPADAEVLFCCSCETIFDLEGTEADYRSDPYLTYNF